MGRDRTGVARVAVILVVVALVAGLSAEARLPTPSARAATLTAGGFTTSASVSAADVAPGGSVTIVARVTSDTDRTMLVDVEVYGPTGVRLSQAAFDNEPLLAGAERSFTVPWSVPAAAATGGYTVMIGILTPGWGRTYHWNDAAGFFTVGMASPPPPGGPARIMPLGDSLTDGYTVEGGYRIDLWTLLSRAGREIDFVGSRYNGPPGLPDKHHEGHPGWRIDQLAGAMTPWLSAYRPQIVLLLIGTNDMIQAYDPAGAPARLSTLIDRIRAALPDAWIVVSSLPRNADLGTLGRIQQYNAAIPGIVAVKGSRVTFVDAFAAIQPQDLDADGTHLTPNGYSRLAGVWLPAVQAILSGSLDPTPTPTPTATAPTPPVGPCSPRPPVRVAVAPAGSGRLAATISASGPGNALRELRVGAARNAWVEAGGQAGAGPFTVTLSGTSPSATIAVSRLRAGESVHVPLVVVDGCGEWPTFVGGGPAAF